MFSDDCLIEDNDAKNESKNNNELNIDKENKEQILSTENKNYEKIVNGGAEITSCDDKDDADTIANLSDSEDITNSIKPQLEISNSISAELCTS